MYANVRFQVDTHLGEVSVHCKNDDTEKKIIKKAKKKLKKKLHINLTGYQYFDIFQKSG